MSHILARKGSSASLRPKKLIFYQILLVSVHVPITVHLAEVGHALHELHCPYVLGAQPHGVHFDQIPRPALVVDGHVDDVVDGRRVHVPRQGDAADAPLARLGLFQRG